MEVENSTIALGDQMPERRSTIDQIFCRAGIFGTDIDTKLTGWKIFRFELLCHKGS
ncbi:hypothetical protein ACX0G9_19865 [Flavitalea flava]